MNPIFCPIIWFRLDLSFFKDDRRASFRSGIFSDRISSIDIGRYSVGFGEDILAKADYSAILGGEDHEITKQGSFLWCLVARDIRLRA